MTSPTGVALININGDQTSNDIRSLNDNTFRGGKNETVTSSVVLVRTHFYSVRMAGLVPWPSDGNGVQGAVCTAAIHQTECPLCAKSRHRNWVKSKHHSRLCVRRPRVPYSARRAARSAVV